MRRTACCDAHFTPRFTPIFRSEFPLLNRPVLSSPRDIAAASYGGHEAGLICGYLFDRAAEESSRAIDSNAAVALSLIHI